jgi:glycosyltransferase involved in cell wall biosynthesis
MRKQIAFVISGLSHGGAEMMLYKLLSRMDRDRFEPEVICLTDIVTLLDRFEQIDVPVTVLGMPRGIPDPRGVLSLARHLGRRRPDFVQTWMYHADLIGGVAAKLAGNLPVIWNIRNGTLAPGAAKKSTVATARVCASLSRLLPERIVCCAEAARDIHVRLGYNAEKMVIIPNGFDLELFRPDPPARQQVRAELGIGEGTLLFGLVARFHPQKDHETFIRAASRVASEIEGVRFLLCGDGLTWENDELVRWIDESGRRENFILLGRRSDIPSITAALDISVSSSRSGEAFSNVIGEAMAAAVPCVATDVGDSAQIVGSTGIIVPHSDRQALAEAMMKMACMGKEERRRLGEEARRRMLEHFSLVRVTSRYEELYEQIPSRKSARKRTQPCP